MRKLITSFVLPVCLAAVAIGQRSPTPPIAPTPAAPATPPVHAAPAVPAVPAAPAQGVMVGRGSYLGVDTRDVTSDRIGPLKLKEERGVEVMMVDQDAPAGKAGLKEHDVIVSSNGQPIDGVDQLRRMIRDTNPGKSLVLGIIRDGQPMSVNVTLADRKELMQGDRTIRIPRIEIPSIDIDVPSIQVLQYSRRNGLVVENLTPQLGDYFGAKGGHGVLVRSVEKGSAAEMAGFRAGDVIVRVGSEWVEASDDWSRIIRQAKPGASLPITVIRERREQNISMMIPERRRGQIDTQQFPTGDIGPDVRELQAELARIGPEIQKSLAEANRNLNSPELRRQIEDAQRQTREAAKIKEKALDRALRDTQRASRQLERQLKEEQKNQPPQANQ